MTSSSPNQNREPLSVIEKLTKDHDLSLFDCGKASLNDWLRRFALTNQQNDSARTYVLHRAGKVVGSMLVDALSRAMIASDAIGARAVLVHAIDEDAVTFYRKFGFEPSPLDPKQLMLLMKDLRASLQSVGLG